MKLPLLNDLDLPKLTEGMRNAPSFPHFCIDNFLEAAFADEVLAAFPSYDEAQRLGTSFHAVNERKKIQITDSTQFPPAILKLHQLMASPEFVATMSQMSGIPGLIADPGLMDGGIHETNSGGHLDVHVDFNYNEELGLHRRLNILVYFNKDWTEEDGGILDLWDADVKQCQGRFLPQFNRAAGFATSSISWHGVTPVTCPAGKMRKSFAVYYYTKEPPPGWNGERHSTIFRARPTEYWKGHVAMPAEHLARAAQKSIHSVRAGLKGLLSK